MRGVQGDPRDHQAARQDLRQGRSAPAEKLEETKPFRKRRYNFLHVALAPLVAAKLMESTAPRVRDKASCLKTS